MRLFAFQKLPQFAEGTQFQTFQDVSNYNWLPQEDEFLMKYIKCVLLSSQKLKVHLIPEKDLK